MRKTYCDLCEREIEKKEDVYTVRITKGEWGKRNYPDVCDKCYRKITDLMANLSKADDDPEK